MQSLGVLRGDREALDILVDQGLVKRLQFARQRLIATEVDGLSRAVHHGPRQPFRVLDVHALQPIPNGQLGPRGHVRIEAEDPVQQARRLGMGKAPHEGRYGGESRALHGEFRALRSEISIARSALSPGYAAGGVDRNQPTIKPLPALLPRPPAPWLEPYLPPSPPSNPRAAALTFCAAC